MFFRIWITSYRERLFDVLPIQQSHQKYYKTFSSSWRVTRKQVMRHATTNGIGRCQSGSSDLLTYSISRATSINSECCRLPTISISRQQSGQITLQSVFIKPKFLKATRHAEIRKIEIPRSMVVEAPSW